MSARRNEVDTIANLAPRTIGYLQIPLTPSRAAALAAFTARTGIGAQALVTDLLDDVIFADFVSEGGEVPCTEHYGDQQRSQSELAASLPQKEQPTANLPSTTQNGSDAHLGASTRTKPGPSCTSQPGSATNASASDMPPAKSDRPPISCARSSAPTTASNGSASSWRARTWLGSPTRSAPSASPSRSTPCGND